MLDVNIDHLNEHYEDLPIFFKFDNGIIKLIEQTPYFLSKNEALKKKLKWRYKLRYSNEDRWHIGKEGVAILSKTLIKFKPSVDLKILKRQLYFYINSISKIPIKDALKNIFDALPEFFSMPASMNRHHSYQFGLLEHSIQVVDFALAMWKVSDQKKIINKDIVIAGSLLHDVGKCHVYEINDNTASPSYVMLEQDHILHGAILIERLFKAKNLEKRDIEKILHIIASHHMTKEWGSAREPLTPEAWLVAIADNISAKIGG